MTITPREYICCSTPFSHVTYTMQIRRKSLYYVINLVLPCCLFSVIAVITFVMPPASGERAGTGQQTTLSRN